MVRLRRRTSAVAAGAATLLCLTTFSGIAGTAAAGAAPSGRTVLGGSEAPALARQHPVGSVSKSSRVDFDLVLQLRDEAGAQALVQAVSTPGSASYRHYVTAAQWEARFSPTAAAVATASNWLRSQGFAVGSVSQDRTTVSASGTAAQVEKAFGTGLENYRLAGNVVRMATSNLSIPTSLAGVVAGAMGINENVATPAVASGSAGSSLASRPSSGDPFPPAPPAFITAKPCGSYYSQKPATVSPPFGHGYPSTVPYEVCGYVPPQFRSAYNVSSSATGTGVTVAIIDAYGSATIAHDATTYFNKNDSSNPFANAHFSQLDATPFNDESQCAPSSWLVEQAIDVEAVHGVAPNANVLYVGAKNCLDTGLLAAEQRVVDHSLANVVTNSWGDTGGDLLTSPATRKAFDDVFMLADATGITVQFSTGDDGDNFNLLGASAADYPAESPYATAVGGTSLKIGSTGQTLGNLGWATGRSFKCTTNFMNAGACSSSQLGMWLPVSYDGGSGGFTSYNYSQPYYQKAAVPAALADRNEFVSNVVPARVIPDISLDADPSTGFLIGLQETFSNGTVGYNQPRYGGTSLASPLLAGLVADADSASIAAGGSYVGFLNPDLYRMDSVSGAISDVVPGGKQAQLRVDHAFTYLGPGATGVLYSFRELTYEGTITYCDATGNCASRPNTLSTATGYDSMTGLGAPGPNFIADLSNF